MRKKKILGIACVIIGIIVLLLGLYARSQVNEARSNASKTSSLFPNNPVKKGIDNAIEGKISSYDAPVLWTMIIGGVIIVIGLGTLYTSSKRRR